VLLLLLAWLQYRLWGPGGSLDEVARLRQAIEVQQQEKAALEERNRTLEAEVQDLKQGSDAIEERARSELGMIKQGETFYLLIEE
jgi:cell division protein FtsB